MSPPRLKGMVPEWSNEDCNGDPADEPVRLLYGSMRIVHRQRARKLRRRGEHLVDLRRDFPLQGFKACYGWVVQR